MFSSLMVAIVVLVLLVMSRGSTVSWSWEGKAWLRKSISFSSRVAITLITYPCASLSFKEGVVDWA